MRTLFLIVFSVLIPSQAFTQKEAPEPREYPWERTARRIEADQEKMARSAKKEDKRENNTSKPETKTGGDGKKGK
ncbi:MAG TPA: hypothetical protein VHB01_06510 [Nitrosospira sp.]|jgi:hypothetical protein|nr:hypothetical protein [Nitrosospira sp.]